MTNKANNNTMSQWIISYDPYTDLFQMYTKDFLQSKRIGLTKIAKKQITIFLKEDTRQPVFIEVKDAHQTLGELENQRKVDIIRRVKPLLETYA